MAETLISPGVLARENDQSHITSQPVQAGAAIIGPTVKGKPYIPTLVTSYTEYLATYGSTFTSGSNRAFRIPAMESDPQTFITSIGLYNTKNELVAVGRLSSPVQKNYQTETTIKVNLTY